VRIIRAEGPDQVGAEGKFMPTQMQADGADERGLVRSICGRPFTCCRILDLDWQNALQKKIDRGWQIASAPGFTWYEKSKVTQLRNLE
jgi:hypothetical protein